MNNAWKLCVIVGMALVTGCGDKTNVVEQPKQFAPRPTEPPGGGLGGKPTTPKNKNKHDNLPTEAS